MKRRDFLTAVAAALGVAPKLLFSARAPVLPALPPPVVYPFMVQECATIQPGKVFFERIFENGPVPFDFILSRIDVWINDLPQDPHDYVLRRLFLTLAVKNQFALGASTGFAPIPLSPPYKHKRGDSFTLDLDMGEQPADLPEPVEVRVILSGLVLHQAVKHV